MKKISLILLATVAVFASCSKHNDAPVIDPSTAWIYDINLPVPIQFNSSSPFTKAGASLIEDDILKSKKIGLIGVQPNRYQSDGSGGYIQATDAVGIGGWSKDESGDDKGTILLDNLAITTGEDGSINTKRYYPLQSTNFYSFFAYYPYSGSEGDLTAEGLTVTYDIADEQEDIIWARSVAPPFSSSYPGFNAKYLREVERRYGVSGITTPNTASNYYPILEFNHLLTAINFYVISADGTQVDNAYVKQIKVKNTYTKASLLVVDKHVTNLKSYVAESKAGTLTAVGEPTGNIVLDCDRVNPSSSYASLGALLIMPTNDPVIMDITISGRIGDDEDGNGIFEDTVMEDVILTRTAGFKAGNRYNFAIKVWGVQKATITALVVDWNDIPVLDDPDNPTTDPTIIVTPQ